jgi:hypothetical protein
MPVLDPHARRFLRLEYPLAISLALAFAMPGAASAEKQKPKQPAPEAALSVDASQASPLGGGHGPFDALELQLLRLQEQMEGVANAAGTAQADHAELIEGLVAIHTSIEALIPIPKTPVMYPPVWSRKLPADDGPPCASSRFACVLDDQAVLDNETGLVWERSPQLFTPDDPGHQSFGLLWGRTPADPHARAFCANRKTGGRQGWRLPYVHELTSLLDVSGAVPPGQPLLSPGHPFDTAAIQNDDQYWSASADATPVISQELPRAFRVNIVTGFVDEILINLKRSVWCVRGAASSGLY